MDPIKQGFNILPMDKNLFAMRLRSLRKDRGLTQQQLAEAMGVSVQAVSQWENGASGISHGRAVSLSQALGTDWNWLVYGIGNKEDHSSRNRWVPLQTKAPIRQAPLLTRELAWKWATDIPNLDFEPESWLDGDGTYESDLQHLEQFSPRYPPVGIVFALSIERESMRPEFDIGDIVLLETNIEPLPGDYVAAKIHSEARVCFRKYKQRRIIDGDEVVIDLIPLNNDYPIHIISTANPGKILGVMVEHRRYRRRR